MSLRFVATMLALSLCGAAAARVEPHLTIGAPWRTVQPVSNPGSSFETIAEWVLPNGRSGATAQDVQYLHVSTSDLDERGLGGYVADEVGSLSRTPTVTNMTYHQIETCLRPAWFVAYDVPVGGVRRTLETVLLAFRSTLYKVQYNRPAGQAIEPGAEASLLAFCDSVPGR